jgi:asparagine synthase (glutamine-hydrolysing)
VRGLAIFSSTPRHVAIQAYELPGDAGIILGRLFPTNDASWSPNWTPKFSAEETARLSSDSGRSFLRKYWGGYIAFFRDYAGSHCQIIRECSGKIPCYRFAHDSVQIFFSDVSDLQTIGLSHFDVDWSYLAAFLYSCDMQVRKTALVGVSELLAGDAVDVNGDSVRHYSVWDPRRIVRTDLISDYEEAKQLLRSTTQQCINAWSSVYDNIALRLSGGLDSAIVLGSLALAQSAPRVTCLHQYSDDPRDDERTYARLAAAAAKVPLIEQLRAPGGDKFDAALTLGQSFPRPNIQAMFGAHDLEANTKIAAGLNAEAAWTGQGGDHLFFQARSSLGAADFVSHNGLDFGLFKAISDSARLSGESYFSVLRSAWKLGRGRAAWKPGEVLERYSMHFLNKDALPDNVEIYTANAWTVDTEDLPKGTRFQIFVLTELLNRHKPLPGVEPVEEHHPLVSQPLIELCLRIPIYNLLRGGRQRALARDAFADRVPSQILQREDKGDTSAYAIDTIRRSEPFVRQLLFDGLLAQHRLISPEALKPYILHGQSLRVEHLWPLLSCVAAELWARAWTDSTVSVAI